MWVRGETVHVLVEQSLTIVLVVDTDTLVVTLLVMMHVWERNFCLCSVHVRWMAAALLLYVRRVRGGCTAPYCVHGVVVSSDEG